MDGSMNIFMQVPWDIKEEISAYLSITDIYFLSLIDKDFEYSLRRKMDGCIDVSFDNRIDYKTLSNIIKIVGSENVKELNLNGLYWLSVVDIKRLLNRLVNLQTVFLLGTKLRSDFNTLKEFKNGVNYYICPLKAEMDGNTSCKMDFCYLKTEKNSSLPKLQKVSFSEKCVDYDTLIDSNWLNNIMTLLKQDNAALRSQLKLDIDLNVNDEAHFKKICEGNNNAREVIIQCGKRSKVKSSKLNLRLLGSFKYLQRLRLELNTNASFLDTLFRECKQLKFLRIVSHVPQFQLTHFKHAESLEDLSFETNGPLNLDNLLTELGDNNRIKLRRIYLKFRNFTSVAKKTLKCFLSVNPQLLVFVIETLMPETLMKDMTKDLQPYCNSPQKQYFFKKHKSTVQTMMHLFCVHYDLINVYMRINPVRER